MADILGRINSYTAKKKNSSQPPAAVRPPVSSVTDIQPVQEEKAEASVLPVNLPGVKPWQEMTAQEAFTAHPQLSPASYLSGVAEYREKNGLPGMSYAEIASALGGRNPMKSIEQAEQEERRLRAAERINAIGSVLANLLNVTRTQAGHPGMNLSGVGNQGQERIDRLRLYGQRLASQNLQDYMGAVARDRAAKSQAAVSAAQQRRWEAQQKANERDYRFGLYKFEAEQAGKEADRARREQAEKSKLEETARHNRSMESIGRTRVAGERRGKEQFIDILGNDGKKSKRYSPTEHGNNWITTAYKDMIDRSGGKESPYKVNKANMFGSESTAPSNQEMYDAISRYNADQWKNRYRTDRYSGSKNPPPLN